MAMMGSVESRGPETRQESQVMRAHMEQLTQSDYVVPLGGESTHLGVGLPTTTAGSQLDERTRLWKKTSALFTKRFKMNPRKLRFLVEDLMELATYAGSC